MDLYKILLSEKCICGHRAIEHSILYWLPHSKNELPLIGPCSCNECTVYRRADPNGLAIGLHEISTGLSISDEGDHLTDILKLLSFDDHDEEIADRLYIYVESRGLLDLGRKPTKNETEELNELLRVLPPITS
jgi:hypothetical protein